MTASERVYDELKQMILRVELQPGTPLVVRQLAAKLKVSPTPVVEAIRRLQHDGLITVVPKWGASVKEWSLDEIAEACHIRRGLEGEAAELFVKRATPEDKRRLMELNDLLRQAASTNRVRLGEVDMELHLHIVRSTRFPRLYRLIENSHIETAAIFGLLLKAASNELVDYTVDISRHDALVDALLGEDPAAARGEAWRHVTRSLELIDMLHTKAVAEMRRQS